MSDRTRVDHYRGRKDSAVALHYLWRVGEAMVTRRDRFERVYALTEAVAPASALREVDETEADDVLARKAVAADGTDAAERHRDHVCLRAQGEPAPNWMRWRDRWLSDGSLVEVRVEGWRARSGRDRCGCGALGRPRGRPGAGRLGADRDDDR